ncbi:hypothetical protein [Nocardioides sp. SYSU DS0651]|uniref:hypothetical protein n=1 Tax=Nocardioides sp. SYSU DS0651 TaxID=3415955 RepID=UPI003F4C5B26
MAHDTHHGRGLKPWQRNKHHHDDHQHDEHYEGRRTAAGQHLDPADRAAIGERHARDEYGGVNLGAAFFGWLVAIALTVLLTSIVGAIASAIGANTDFSQNDVQREAGAIGLGVAIGFVIVMAIAYYAGGYVAGRMSRFDGGKQGLAVWLIGLVVTLLAVGLGWAFGSQYNILDRVSLPRFPIPTDAATVGGIITAAALLLGTLLAAMAGGKVGRRYHSKVDRVARY